MSHSQTNFSDQLVLAPIRGITNFIYRNSLTKHFGGVDSAIAPYITTQHDNKLNSRQLEDITHNKNDLLTVGQVLTKEVDQFLHVAHAFKDKGVQEINLNMGCPYPMVTSKMKGSGLLSHPEKVKELLSGIIKDCPISFSVKLRLGHQDVNEIKAIIPILNKLKIDNVTIHPRVGKQLYRGDVYLEEFEKCLKFLPTPPCYNGDINSVQDFFELKKRFPTVTKWMVGRGALSNPALFSQIKGIQYNGEQYKTKLYNMHRDITKGFLELDNGKSDFLNKMYGQWVYLSEVFENPHKTVKKIKKAKSIDHYSDAVEWIFNQNISERVINI